MDRAFFSFLGWTFLPTTATRFAQSTYYSITVRAGEPRPQPGSPKWIKHNRRIHILLVIGYLLFTVYDAYDTIKKEGDFYQALGIGHDANDRAIKSRFRRLAALHHPDKLSADPEGLISDAHFVYLRLAQDTLLNPVQRFAYDRFGPDMLRWEHCASIRDYLMVGFRVYAPSYIMTVLITLLLGVMGYLNWGRYWRYLSIASLLLLEVYTLTRPYSPTFIVKVINPLITIIPAQTPLLPFQMLALARKITLTISIAFSQLGPYFQSALGQAYSTVDGLRLARLEQLAQGNETEATRFLRTEVTPYVEEEQWSRKLKGGIREWLVQNTIRADPLVREALGNEREKREHRAEDSES